MVPINIWYLYGEYFVEREQHKLEQCLYVDMSSLDGIHSTAQTVIPMGMIYNPLTV